ncbi:bifunctional 3-(3-hydroxy-phenyl)propionate/3-hydroxycinnamic acid hydroxylase [Mycobacterium sp.]|uniref:bifunctional 3-(3-hydroxy-phenyl)propionate/3-hydroxycinnamic acid hydroxylase MhpA n=1 Tax=Mycobacterium sp. TaxID=1785 RepID=UPI0025CDD672|nr:bifunctional 3-(3-hydroxy-phenyl)propionate/3-hydroxycinnamic acid hydroxylase [Mycobacterium sp.]MBW0014498.1 bifunctional 3-(3-hydroxy-phenyl)propionate/3-hydroxycinnamic acid hydroxylase [Mycobacterium sp.]
MTDIPHFVPVVIVGAGPVGVTTATILAQYGVDCLLLDRWANVYPQPRAVHIDDEVRRIIARLGIDDQFAAISRPARGLQLRDPNMNVLSQFRREELETANGYPQANMFDQPELEALLRSNLKHYPHAVFRGDSEVTDIVQLNANRVRVTYADRETGTGHRVETSYLLGCDGANSLVRSAIGATMGDMGFEQRWLVVDVTTDAELNQWDGVHQVCDPHRAGTFMRVGPSRYRWEFRLLADETVDDFGTIATLYSLIRPWVQGVSPECMELVRVAEYTFRAKVADHWRRDNVFLLGDAAHLTPPFIGQGLCAGLRDAMNLGWKLAAVVNGWLPESVLDSYEDERKPHATYMIRFALAMGLTMTAGGEVGNHLRRMLVPRLHLIPGVRDKVTDSKTPALRRSALVLKRGRRRGLAGRLCPNPVLAEGKRFDEVVGTRFAVVTSGSLSTQQRDELGRRGAVVVAAEPGSELARWLRRGHAIAAVVRPDGTVMYAVGNVGEISRRLPDFPRSRADA